MRAGASSTSCRCSAASGAPAGDADARGAVSGLTFETTPRDLVRAALEGVAHRLAEIARAAAGGRGDRRERRRAARQPGLGADPRGRARAAGDALRPSTRPRHAAPRCSRWSGSASRRRRAPLGRRFEPRPERFEAHRAARERQRALYETADLILLAHEPRAPPPRCAAASIPAAASSSAGLPGVRKLPHRELDDARPLLDVCERVEHGVAEPSLGPVVLDRDDRRRDRAQRLGVDRLDGVEVDHARLDPVARQRLRRLQRLVERDPGADQRDVVAVAAASASRRPGTSSSAA